ncbi:MAG: class I SAM-dependent methyltransferase [Burkholderiales bacterium]|nr:class I SAM-dependent methyltransferase [Burkholderiales bacterium]
MNESIRDSYNAIPYESHAFPQTHPDRLHVMARLFGMQPAALAGARVLELGCGSGGNLIPMAAAMPEATFVGIDLAPRHIEIARARVAELGLANIELRAADLLDVADSLGEADYIIAHGVYSWVPPAVQDALLHLVATKLARNGVAFVSYNTNPGWRMRGTIRDFMLYHVRQFTDPATRIAQARAMLDFMAQNTPDDTGPFAILLKRELESMRQAADAYLFHDFLEPNNEPVYFHEFVERAATHRLQYLAESEFATMLASNFSATVAQTLHKIAPDLVRSEQLMDFLRNRQFRQTLLVHADVPLTRAVDAGIVRGFEIASMARPTTPSVDLRSTEKIRYELPNGPGVATVSPITKAAFQILAECWPLGVPFAELCSAARGRLGTLPTVLPDAAQTAQDASVLAAEFLQCAAANIVELRPRPLPIALDPGTRPAAYAVARQEAKTGLQVSNLRHETAVLDEFHRQFLLLLDGTRDRASLVDELTQIVASNALAIQQDGVEIRDPASVRRVMATSVDQALVGLARAGLFPRH